MSRVWAALAALLFWLPAFVEAAPSVRHGAAAKAPFCRAGSVRLGGGLCCPRSGVTRGGGCVSGAIRPAIVPPPLAYCPGGDALGRCPAPSCMHGYSRDRFGQCRIDVVSCASGLAPDALGHCPAEIVKPRLCANGGAPDVLGRCGADTFCPGGGLAGASGCPPTPPLAKPSLAPALQSPPPLVLPHLAAPAPIVQPVAPPAPVALPHIAPPPAAKPR